MLHTRASFQVVAAGILDQNTPHQLARKREKMRTILPLHPLAVDQAQVGFMDQGRGLQAMSGSLAPHVMMREAAEFRIDDWDQVFECIVVPSGPGAQQFTYVVHSVWNYTPGHLPEKLSPRMSAFVGHSAPSGVEAI